MFAKATPLVRCLAAFLVCSISFSGWAEEMTSDQLAEAQKMAREMVEANPKLIGE